MGKEGRKKEEKKRIVCWKNDFYDYFYRIVRIVGKLIKKMQMFSFIFGL